jgi:hypothetical protein
MVSWQPKPDWSIHDSDTPKEYNYNVNVGSVTAGKENKVAAKNGNRSNDGIRVIEISTENIREDVETELAKVGMTMETFIERGEADELEDFFLRDLWMLTGPALVDSVK